MTCIDVLCISNMVFECGLIYNKLYKFSPLTPHGTLAYMCPQPVLWRASWDIFIGPPKMYILFYSNNILFIRSTSIYNNILYKVVRHRRPALYNRSNDYETAFNPAQHYISTTYVICLPTFILSVYYIHYNNALFVKFPHHHTASL